MVSGLEGGEEQELEAGWREVCTLLGRGREHLVDRVIQLVVADTHYVG